MAPTTRKRQRSSSERNQGHEANDDFRLDALARMIMTKTAFKKKEMRPIQGYVTREKYVSLMETYNNLQASYEALQNRFRETLECLRSLGDSGVESDGNDEHNGESPQNSENVLDSERNYEYEEVTENIGGEISENEDEHAGEDDQEMPEDNDQTLEESNTGQEEDSEEETEDIIINTDAYISDVQWEILLRSQSVKFFVESILQILFERTTLLNCTLPSDSGNSSSDVLDKKKIEVLRVLLDRYLEERKPTISDEQKETGKKEWRNHISSYITSLKVKQKEGSL